MSDDRVQPETPASSTSALTDARAPRSESELKTVIRRLGPAGPLALVAATLPALGGFLLLGTLNVVGPWLRSHDELGIALYVSGFAVLSGLAVLPTYAQAVLGGWAFGFQIGFPAAWGGFVGGALIGYGVALRATGDRVVRLIEEKPKWRAVYKALLRSGFWKTLLIVTLVRIPLNSPFAITNLVMAATRVPPLAYIIGTLVGMAPRTAAAVVIAAGVKELTIKGTAPSWMWIVSAVATVVVVVVIGVIANRAVAKVTAGDSTVDE